MNDSDPSLGSSGFRNFSVISETFRRQLKKTKTAEAGVVLKVTDKVYNQLVDAPSD